MRLFVEVMNYILIIRPVYARYVSHGSVLHSLQYVASAAKRLRCVKTIEPGEVEHPGPHIHSNEMQPFHFCESR
jgi:hypothetical protein